MKAISLSRVLSVYSILLILTACTTEPTLDLEPYFYPTDAIANSPVVYEYQDVTTQGDTIHAPYYWYYQVLEKDDQRYLVGSRYDDLYEPTSLSRELLTDSMVQLDATIIYSYDTTGLAQSIYAEINTGEQYYYRPQPPRRVWVTDLSLTLADENYIRLTRNRQYSRDTTVTFGGQTLDAIVVNVRETTTNNAIAVPIETVGYEIYARDLGLHTLHTRQLDGTLARTYTLFLGACMRP